MKTEDRCQYQQPGVICYSHQCKGCGWEKKEHKRRIAKINADNPHPTLDKPYKLHLQSKEARNAE
jgi:hypothetical protein